MFRHLEVYVSAHQPHSSGRRDDTVNQRFAQTIALMRHEAMKELRAAYAIGPIWKLRNNRALFRLLRSADGSGARGG